jgi:hypothetical protein
MYTSPLLFESSSRSQNLAMHVLNTDTIYLQILPVYVVLTVFSPVISKRRCKTLCLWLQGHSHQFFEIIPLNHRLGQN